MGYNIEDVSGNLTGGVDQWNYTLDLRNGNSFSGDFNVVSIVTGADQGESTDGYTYSSVSNSSYGTVSGNATDGTFTFTANRSAVIQSGSDQTVSFTITGTSGGNSDTDTVNVTILICVARGTRIETASGPKPVELLQHGDLVRTHGGPDRPVRWIGSRRVGAEELRTHPELRPVRIGASAFGPGLPARDLLVSPQHRVLVSDWRAELMFGAREVLVPAKALVNDGSITVDDSVGEVEYFHVLLDAHEVIFTEALPTESFHPGAWALGGLEAETRKELLILFPQLRGPDGYGPTARLALKPREGVLLAGAIGQTPDGEAMTGAMA